MHKRTVEMPHESDMSVCAVSRFAIEAAKFKSDITLQNDSRSVDGKSVLGLGSLVFTGRAPLLLTVCGPDEDEALERLCEILEQINGSVCKQDKE